MNLSLSVNHHRDVTGFNYNTMRHDTLRCSQKQCRGDQLNTPHGTVTEMITKQELSSCWDGRPFGHNRRGQKIGGCCAPFRGEAGSPSNTMSHGPRPISVPSGILIHPTVWPQYT